MVAGREIDPRFILTPFFIGKAVYIKFAVESNNST